MLDCWTARQGYRGHDRLDISRQAQDPRGRYFAPSADTMLPVMTALRKEVAVEFRQFSESYALDMRASLRRHKRHWDWLLAQPSVTLVCHCASPLRCHRSLLAAMLERLGGVRLLGEREQVAAK